MAYLYAKSGVIRRLRGSLQPITERSSAEKWHGICTNAMPLTKEKWRGNGLEVHITSFPFLFPVVWYPKPGMIVGSLTGKRSPIDSCTTENWASYLVFCRMTIECICVCCVSQILCLPGTLDNSRFC